MDRNVNMADGGEILSDEEVRDHVTRWEAREDAGHVTSLKFQDGGDHMTSLTFKDGGGEPRLQIKDGGDHVISSNFQDGADAMSLNFKDGGPHRRAVEFKDGGGLLTNKARSDIGLPRTPGVMESDELQQTVGTLMAQLNLMTNRFENLERSVNTRLTLSPQDDISLRVHADTGARSKSLPRMQQPMLSSPNTWPQNTSNVTFRSPVTHNSPPLFSRARSPSVRIKPNDVAKLELATLQQVDSGARLQMFFGAIEKCASDSYGRLEIAKTRVDTDLAVLIHTAQLHGNIFDWESCKNYLAQEFGTVILFDQAWRQVDCLSYDWIENPQVFVNKFKCNYAAIKGTFPNESLPNRDTLIKKKLVQGFPRQSRDALEVFVDESITLKSFLNHVEHERVVLMRTRVNLDSYPDSVARSVEGPGCIPAVAGSSVSAVGESSQVSGQKSTELSEIGSALKNIQNQLAKTPQNRPRVNRQYCAFCRNASHSLRDCRKKPGPGRCWDCLKYGCRRGNPACPGPQGQRSSPHNVNRSNFGNSGPNPHPPPYPSQLPYPRTSAEGSVAAAQDNHSFASSEL